MSHQIARLEAALAEAGFVSARVVSADLLELEDVERHIALDAIVADEPSPYVIVRGQLVCTGAIDPVAVLSSLQ